MSDPSRLGLMSHVLGLKSGAQDTAYRRIGELGFRSSDVTHIILTHLDLDHAGGLPDFPHAVVHVLNAERRSAFTPSGFRQRQRYRACHWRHQPIWRTYDSSSGETWNGFERVRALDGLPSELLLVSLPGHTPGHAGVAIQTEAGWILHVGDAYYDRREINVNPAVTFGMGLFQKISHDDFALASATKNRLRKIGSESQNIRLICSHDPEERVGSLRESETSG